MVWTDRTPFKAKNAAPQGPRGSVWPLSASSWRAWGCKPYLAWARRACLLSPVTGHCPMTAERITLLFIECALAVCPLTITMEFMADTLTESDSDFSEKVYNHFGSLQSNSLQAFDCKNMREGASIAWFYCRNKTRCKMIVRIQSTKFSSPLPSRTVQPVQLTFENA